MAIIGIQKDILTRLRNGSEHRMIQAIVRKVFNEHTRQDKKQEMIFTTEDVIEISIIKERLQHLGLVCSASVLECEVDKTLYSTQVLSTILEQYPDKRRLTSIYNVKSDGIIPEPKDKLYEEKMPIAPISTLKDINIFRENIGIEMAESRKLVNLRKKLDEEYESDDDNVTIEDEQLTEKEEHTDNADEISAESVATDDDETLTSPSVSEEEITTNWTKGLLSSSLNRTTNSEKILAAKPTKDAQPSFPPLPLQRLPPIVRAPLNIPPVARIERTPHTTSNSESDVSDGEKRNSTAKNKINFSPPQASFQATEEISGDLEELNFDDVPGDFSDSAESISF